MNSDGLIMRVVRIFTAASRRRSSKDKNLAFYTIAEARTAAGRVTGTATLRKSASTVLTEETAKAKDSDRYDVFLSHCLDDAEAIVGVKAILESQGHSVYVD